MFSKSETQQFLTRATQAGDLLTEQMRASHIFTQHKQGQINFQTMDSCFGNKSVKGVKKTKKT
jgi:hypothetical protein